LAHSLHHALDLPGGHLDGAGFGQMTFRFWVAGLIGTKQISRAKAGV
jgi:hypothetical protein